MRIASNLRKATGSVLPLLFAPKLTLGKRVRRMCVLLATGASTITVPLLRGEHTPSKMRFIPSYIVTVGFKCTTKINSAFTWQTTHATFDALFSTTSPQQRYLSIPLKCGVALGSSGGKARARSSRYILPTIRSRRKACMSVYSPVQLLAWLGGGGGGGR